MRTPGRRYFNTEGIVVRARDLGEADRIVILLTPNRGLVSAVARSARRTNSRTGGHVDLLRHITAQISEGRSDLHTISQVETVNAHLPLRSDLDRLTLASHFAEITERFALPNASNPPLFNLLRDTLTHTDTTPKSSLPLLRLWHELTLLTVVGLQPQLHRCVRTNTEIPPGDHFFSPAEGGLIRRPDQMDNSSSPDPIYYDRSSDHTQTFPIISTTLNTIKLLRHITRTTDWPRLTNLRVNPADIDGGLNAIGAMLRFQQERGVGRAERVMGEMGNA